MSTVFLTVTWDDEYCQEWQDMGFHRNGDERVVAVWTCSANDLGMTSWGVWENVTDRSTEGLKEELTLKEFTEKYDLDINYYCRPGGKFTIRGEVSWVCQAADRRMI